MAGSISIRYYPTFVVALAILFIAFLAEQQHDRVLIQDTWESTGSKVDNVRSRFERLLDADIQKTNQLAHVLGTLAEPTQSQFDEHVEQTFRGQSEVFLSEMAPDFVTSFVHPLDGNEDRLGVALLENPNEQGGALRIRSSLSARLNGPFMSADGTKALSLRVPILSYEKGSEILRGALSVQLDVHEMLRQSGVSDDEGDVEFAIMFESDLGGLENVVYGSSAIATDTAVSSEISLPTGNWTILARPVDGWEPSTAERMAYRLWLLLLGSLVLAPALTANWFAVARRQTIRELEKTEAHLSGILKNMPGAVYTYTMEAGRSPSAEDKVVFFDKDAFTRIWGFPAEWAEADVRKMWDVVSDKSIVPKFIAEIESSARELRPWHFTWPIRLADGTEKWLEGRGHPTLLANGATCWFSMIVDVTHEIARATELEQQQELTYLAQKNDSLGKLTGGVAHDFNNLLAVIMGNQELLREEFDTWDPPRTDLLEFVDNSLLATERGADLTRKMLSFARRARLEPAVLDLNDIVRETNTWAGRTMPESVRLQTSLDADLQMVRVDRGSAESALLNLMVNARDAMPDGGTLYIETFGVILEKDHPYCRNPGIEPGQYVQLVVRDTGKGISPDVLPRIFEPFFTTKPPASGSGLGLSMVQGFMEQSGGAVLVSSDPGVGTTFRLFFRALERTETQPSSDVSAEPVIEHAKARILLAEDEPDVRQVLVSTLRKAGYEIVEAPSGDAAFGAFKQAPDIDLLLTDIVMPGTLQGTDLAQAIRCMSPGLPVIFLSGYASDAASAAAADTAQGDSGDLRLTKPVARRDLIAAIEASISRPGAVPASDPGGADP